MLLSAYLLLSENPDKILGTLTSDLGRQLISEASDDLIVLQDYIKNRKTVFKTALNVDEVCDMAYSYFIYTQTGECSQHVYASPDCDTDRFGNTNENRNGEFIYNKATNIFTAKSVYQVYNDTSIDFPIEEEFNVFIKKWIANSKTLYKISSINTLGFNENHEFGYNRKFSADRVDTKSIELIQAVFDLASGSDSTGTSSRIDYILECIRNILGTPKQSRIIFNSTYNQLNGLRSEDKSQGYEGMLFKRFNQIIQDLGRTQTNYSEQINRIIHDCKVIFEAINNNNSITAKEYDDPDKLLENMPEYLANSYRVDDSTKKFVYDLYSSSSSAKAMPRSTLSILELYFLLREITVEGVNLTLGLNDFTEEDYLKASKELYDVFTIPFFYGDGVEDLRSVVYNTYGLAEEEDRLNKPNKRLINFAFVVARSVSSHQERNRLIRQLEGRMM